MSIYEEDESEITDYKLTPENFVEMVKDGVFDSEQSVIGVLATEDNDMILSALVNKYTAHLVDSGQLDSSKKREKQKDIKQAVIMQRIRTLGTERVYAKDNAIWYQRVDKPVHLQLANFDIISQKIVTSESGDKSIIWEIRFTNVLKQSETAEISISSSHLKRAKDLQARVASRHPYAFIKDGPDTLERIIRYAGDIDNVPVSMLYNRSTYGFHEHDGKKILLHGEGITPEIDHEIIYSGEAPAGMFSIPKEAKLEEAQSFLKNFVKTNNEMKTLTVLGWMMASIVKTHMLERVDECKLPVLFLYGNKQTGKSTLIKVIARAMGWKGLTGEGEEISLQNTTVAQIRDIMCGYGSMPVIFGEYRSANANSNVITRSILSLYDSMSNTKKGGKDKETGHYDSISQRYISPTVFLGNDYITDDAASSRILRVDILREEREGDSFRDSMEKAKLISPGCVGHFAYNWVLEKSDEISGVIDAGYQVAKGVSEKPEERAFAAAACVSIGLELCNKIFGDIVSSHQMQEVAKHVLQSMQSKDSDTLAAQFIEFLAENHASKPGSWVNRMNIDGTIAFKSEWWSRFREYLLKNNNSDIQSTSSIKTSILNDTKDVLTPNVQVQNPLNRTNSRMLKLSVLKAEEIFGIDPSTWAGENEVLL